MTSPLVNKTRSGYRSSKGTQKKRSSISEGLFREAGGRLVGSSGSKRSSLFSASPKANCRASKSSLKHIPTHFHEHRRREDEDSGDVLHPAPKGKQGPTGMDLHDDNSSVNAGSDLGDSDENEEQDWLDDSTLIAQYQDAESETEEERALALVEYLQSPPDPVSRIPFQEKFHELKRDLCSNLITTINDIRQAHIRIGREVDVDRGGGIIKFNDACDKRHVHASYVQAQLKDSMAGNQDEIKKLFVQLKQAYDDRNQLWIDLQARIDEITNLQAAVLDQLDDNMARTIATLEKQFKIMMKDDTSKEKEKLIRGVLGKL